MKTLLKQPLIALGLLGAAALSVPAHADELQTLKNLERERAALVTQLFVVELPSAQRQQAIQTRLRRVVDLERMVLRDDRLVGATHQLIKRAFDNYELTFLAHASIEQDTSVASHFLEHVGLSTDALLNSQVSYRAASTLADW